MTLPDREDIESLGKFIDKLKVRVKRLEDLGRSTGSPSGGNVAIAAGITAAVVLVLESIYDCAKEELDAE